MAEDDQRDSDLPEFGQRHPQQVLYGLDSEKTRNRGFLTENDRTYLLRRNLSGQTERNARMRIRDRILASYFDARFLRYISDEDRRLIFEKARDDYDLHLREAVKEFIRFTYRGLADYNVDATEVLEAGILEAERDRARNNAEVVDVDVSVTVEREEGPEISDLKVRFENHERLSRDELAALVNSPYTNIDLVDAIYHEARQLHSDPNPPEYSSTDMGKGASQYSWEDPDAEEAEEIVEELKSLFEEHSIESYEDYDVAYDRLKLTEDEDGEELWDLVRRLSRCAPQFEEQLAEEVSLSTGDMELLHDIIWNPENIDVEDAVKPPTAGPDWDPEEDEDLQKFIARVEVARERGVVLYSWSDEHRRRWQRLRDLAGFDEDKWGKYMEEQRVNRVKDAIESLFEERKNLTRSEIDGVSSHEEFREQFAGEGDGEVAYLVTRYGDHVLEKALEELATEWSEEDR